MNFKAEVSLFKAIERRHGKDTKKLELGNNSTMQKQ